VDSNYLDRLNPQQRLAVDTAQGPLLVLAGAGSGKTKTLTARIAHLLEQGVKPWEILAITFTNKAAEEMRSRITALVGDAAKDMWIYTFHAMCVQILRRNISALPGYTRWFSIYDDDDQQKVIKECCKELNLNVEYYKPRMVSSFISDCKNQMKSPQEAARELNNRGWTDTGITKLYDAYEAKLLASNALDFDDLLVRTLELFVQCPSVMDAYAQRFRYIHVDEYQDTNMVQYELVKALSSYHGNLCVVGDDDQSIYGWRGADIRNILEFEKDFANAQVIRLEQNYRSTSRILDAANGVIAHNIGRKKKTLWSTRGEGEKMIYYAARDDRDEADFVAREMKSLRSNFDYHQMAVLYRTNAQSRQLEDTLLRNGIRYRMVGGIRFYDRMEIKDLTAYLRMLLNPADEISFARIINTPKRGAGDGTVTAVLEAARAAQMPIMVWLSQEELVKPVVKRSAVVAALTQFAKTMLNLAERVSDTDLMNLVKQVLKDTGYAGQFAADDPEGQARIENLGEYLNAVGQYMESAREPTLEDFLQNVALASDWDKTLEQESAVTLMTMHAAKGLEYPVVFVIGMEEGLFPHMRALDDPDQMEEERRLCYVAITRAMDRLYFTSAMQRMMYGNTQQNPPSRFIKEVPSDLMKKTGSALPFQDDEHMTKKPAASGISAPFTPSFRGGVSGLNKPKLQTAKPVVHDQHFQMGDKVEHKIFGKGTIVAIAGDQGKRNLTVAFEGKGVKILSEAQAPLTKVE